MITQPATQELPSISPDTEPYVARKQSHSEFLVLRGVRYHVRRWGPDCAPLVVMVHGWLDMSASYQFIVDALSSNWRIVAPDWSGFGLSGCRDGTYGYADYLADLDALLDYYSPVAPAYALIGHSLGGNTAGMYAGIRPDRIQRLITMEGFGPVPPMSGEFERKRVLSWLDGLKTGGRRTIYPDKRQFATRLLKQNPRLGADRALFLAEAFARPAGDGFEFAADPVHQRVLGQPRVGGNFYKACWSQVTGPALWVAANQSHQMRAYMKHEEGREFYRAALESFRDVREVLIDDASHNLHHDQPVKVAQAIESFLRTTTVAAPT